MLISRYCLNNKDGILTYKRKFNNENLYVPKKIERSLYGSKHISAATRKKNISSLSRWSIGLLLNGINNASAVDGYLQSRKQIHDKGITGKNQIITIVDTGIDTNLSFFKDDKILVPYNKIDLRHRKIVRYDSISDSDDRPSGHGTHISSIASASSSQYPEKLYNGIAPDSKIYFVDISSDQDDDTFSESYDNAIIPEKMKETGSFIYSNSWGFPESRTSERFLLDKIAYENPEILFVFACGNDGYNQSINQPSGSKNVLAVGSTTEPIYSKLENIPTREVSLNFNKTKICLNPILWGLDFFSLIRMKPLSFLEKRSIVSKNENNIVGSIVFMNSSIDSCEDALSISEQNPMMIIIKSEKYFRCIEKVKVPVFFVNETIPFVENVTVSVVPDPIVNLSVVWFSSKGPDVSGLLKPDLVAPGDKIMAATAHPKSSDDIVHRRTGTSESTPFISGSAALIRQYLEDKGMKPSSSLLRALLIHSAEPVGHSDYKPTTIDGFGIPNLSNVINFGEIPTILIDDFVVKQNTEYFARFTVNDSSKQLRLTMAYLDPPLNISSPYILDADIDLLIQTPSGDFVYGNSEEESLSTTERIVYNNPTKGLYHLYIKGNSMLNAKSVNCSIVLSGGIKEKELVFMSKRQSSDCKEFRTGNNCQLQPLILRPNSEINRTLPFRQWSFVVVPMSYVPMHHRVAINVTSQHEVGEQDPVVEVSFQKPRKYGGSLMHAEVSKASTFLQTNITRSFFNSKSAIYVGILSRRPIPESVVVLVSTIENRFNGKLILLFSVLLTLMLIASLVCFTMIAVLSKRDMRDDTVCLLSDGENEIL